MKYYVTVDFEKEPVLRTDDFKEAKAFAKDLVKDETHLESRVYTDGTNEFVSFYNPFIKNRYGVHLTLNKQREIGFFLKPSLKNEESAYYNSDRDELYIARELIAEHPKFETIESFANFVQCYLNHSKK